jgi:hypothetical protein
LRRISLEPGFEPFHYQALSFAEVGVDGRGPVRRVDELLRRAGRVRQAHIGERERRVLRDRLLVHAMGIGDTQLLGEVARAQIQLARFVGRGRDWNLAGWVRRLARGQGTAREHEERANEPARCAPSALFALSAFHRNTS